MRNLIASMGSGGSHRIVLRLIGVDEGGQHVEAVAVARPGFGAPEALDLFERGFIIPFDRIGLTSAAMIHLSDVDLIAVMAQVSSRRVVHGAAVRALRLCHPIPPRFTYALCASADRSRDDLPPPGEGEDACVT